MGRRKRNGEDEDNGFAAWGGYMEAKKAKLIEQFSKNTEGQVERLTDVLTGVAIYVNGHTKPTAEDLKVLMAEHGGVYHTYQCAATTHIIASNLPNVKINKLGSVPIVKPGWIEDSIALGRLLDYSKYLLYTNRSRTQPRLNFKPVPKNETASMLEGATETSSNSDTKLSPCSAKCRVTSNFEQDNVVADCSYVKHEVRSAISRSLSAILTGSSAIKNNVTAAKCDYVKLEVSAPIGGGTKFKNTEVNTTDEISDSNNSEPECSVVINKNNLIDKSVHKTETSNSLSLSDTKEGGKYYITKNSSLLADTKKRNCNAIESQFYVFGDEILTRSSDSGRECIIETDISNTDNNVMTNSFALNVQHSESAANDKIAAKFVDTNPKKSTINTNFGKINSNSSTMSSNSCTINSNSLTMNCNSSMINSNSTTMNSNSTTMNSTINSNFGKINSNSSNSCTVITNSITMNSNSSTINNNSSTINSNSSAINSIIKNNSSTVDSNSNTLNGNPITVNSNAGDLNRHVCTKNNKMASNCEDSNDERTGIENRNLNTANYKPSGEHSRNNTESSVSDGNCSAIDSTNNITFGNSEFEHAKVIGTSLRTLNHESKENIGPAVSTSTAVTGCSSRLTKTASDPKFLAEFYNNSRLHLISTLGAEFKQLINDMREKSDRTFPGLERLLIKGALSQHSSLPSETVIMHIDMDCFFVSVGLRSRPELRGKPVAVTHSKGGPTRGNVDRQAEIAMYRERLPEGAKSRLYEIDNNCSLSEIASCSYEARRRGIKNGMFMGAALKLCPELKAIPYDFQGYREVSKTLYSTIAEHTLDIEAVSCDEMYVDVTRVLERTGMSVLEWAAHVRSEITSRTGCPCSAGFGANRLQARLATRRAKPNGWFHLNPDEVEAYMDGTELADLPGVGRAALAKLKILGLETCGDVQMSSISLLRKELGVKIGETIWEQARGVDKRPLKYDHERKSVSAEVNYGIRFKSNEEALSFLQSLSVEVRTRLQDIGTKAKCVTLKLMVRAQDAPVETAKYLGHGVCDGLSRSTTVSTATDDAAVIFKEVKALYEKLGLPFSDLRGVGIQLTRLEKEAAMNSVLKNFLSKAPTSHKTSSNTNGATEMVEDALMPESESKLTNPEQSVGTLVERTAQSWTVNPVQNISALTKDSALTRKGAPKTGKSQKPGTRGRPKGSKSVKKDVNKTSNLSNYFKSTQKDRNVAVKRKLSSPQKIDLSVLEQLPADIRAEVIREYNIDMTANENLSPIPHSNRNSTTIKQRKVVEKCSEVGRESKKLTRPNFESLNPEDFKTMLRNWLDSGPEPLAVDIDMLASYFKKLAIERKIEQLHIITKFLHRHVEQKGDCVWHEVYYSIINAAQEGMISTYGGTLCVPRSFSCPRH